MLEQGKQLIDVALDVVPKAKPIRERVKVKKVLIG